MIQRTFFLRTTSILFWALSLLAIKSHSQSKPVAILPIRQQVVLYFAELEKTIPYDLAQAQQYLLLAEPMVKKLHSKKYWSRYFQLAGRLAAYKKAPARAVRYYFLAIDYFQKTRNTNGLVESYLELGNIYLHLFNTQKASSYYQSGLNLLKGKEQKFKQLAIQLYLQIAKSFIARSQYDMAFKSLDKGAALTQKTSLYSESSKLWLTYGDIYEHQKKYDQAAKTYAAAWSIAQNQKLNAIEIIVLTKQSKLALQLQQPKIARQYAFLAREKARVIQDQDAFNISNYQLAECFFAQKQLDSALYYNTQVIKVVRRQNQDSLLSIVLPLQAKIFERQGQIAAALSVFDELKILEDKHPKVETLIGERLWEEMTIKRTEEEVQSKFAKALEQRIRLRYLGTFFGVLIALISLFFLIQARVRNNANRILDAQNQQIEIQNEQLENLNHIKNQLFAIISHDLQSPLFAVRTVLNNISQLDTDPNNRNRLMQILHQQSIKTGVLFENLLCWASIQMNSYQPINDQFFLLPLVKEIEEEVDFMYQQKQLKYQINITPNVKLNADLGMIRMAIRNILVNAVKFSAAEGKIEISANLSHEEAKISIKDEGIGMKEDEISQALYGRLSRLGTQAEAGSGIGLSLVRQFLRYQQGHLEIQSAPQQGTVVTIVIPQ